MDRRNIGVQEEEAKTIRYEISYKDILYTGGVVTIYSNCKQLEPVIIVNITYL